MELYQLQSFVTVAETGHMTRAAEQLCITQPALSVQIKSLEQGFGLKLFKRTSKGMMLTDEGKILLKQARKVLAEAQHLKDKAKSLREEVVGVVRLGLNSDPGYLRIPEFAEALKLSHPRIDIHFLQSISHKVTAEVRSEKLDAGFLFGDPPKEDLVSVKVSPVTLHVVGPAKWKQRMEEADWAKLMDLPWVWVPPEAPFHKVASRKLASLGLKSKTNTVADREDTLNALVSAGVGISIMRDDEAQASQAAGKLHIWSRETMSTDLYFVYRKDRAHTPLMKALDKAVRKVWSL